MVFLKETCLLLYLLPADLSLTSDTLCQWGHRRLYGPPLSEPPGSMCEGVWRESVHPPLLGQCGFYEPAFLRKLPRCLLQTLMLGATAFLETLHSAQQPKMISEYIPGLLLAPAILFCVPIEHRRFCENSCIFFHTAITILFSKEFLYLFFNTFMQNLNTCIFHFHVCVVNMLTPVCSVLPGQRLCLFLMCTKCKHNRHLSLNECYHCTEHWGYLGSFCPYQAHRLIKELAASEWLQGK